MRETQLNNTVTSQFQAIQTFTWDAEGRLTKINFTDTRTTDNDPAYTWTAAYDPLGRRIQNTLDYTDPTLGEPVTIDSQYDPQVEFLEIAVIVNGKRTWKFYGNDINSGYGTMQGIGGLQATIYEPLAKVTPMIDDAHGNILASIDTQKTATSTDDTTTWNVQQMSGYGPHYGNDSPALAKTATVEQSLTWQGRYADPTGFYILGERYLDHRGGRFLSADSLGHAASMDLYSYSGDPINFVDPTGRDIEDVTTILGSGFPGIVLGNVAGHTVNIVEDHFDGINSAIDGNSNAVGNGYQVLAGGNPQALNEYGNNDIFTLDLVQSKAFDAIVRADVIAEVSNGNLSGEVGVPATLGADSTAGRVIADGIAYVTAGNFGTPITEAIVGSYNVKWTAEYNSETGITIVNYNGNNVSGAQSLSRVSNDSSLPSLQDLLTQEGVSAENGIYSIFNNNPAGPNGPLTNVRQTFSKTEELVIDPVAGKNPGRTFK